MGISFPYNDQTVYHNLRSKPTCRLIMPYHSNHGWLSIKPMQKDLSIIWDQKKKSLSLIIILHV